MSISPRLSVAPAVVFAAFVLVTFQSAGMARADEAVSLPSKPMDFGTRGPVRVTESMVAGRPGVVAKKPAARTAAAALSVASGSIKNAPISTGLNGEQTNPAVVGDAGDPIVIWTDTRNGPSDIYAQKLTPTMAPLWIPNGLPVCKATGGQVNPQAASDGAGGVIVVWEDHRTDAGDIYAQRINSLGLPVWASNGVPICTSVNAQRQPVIVSDETGGAVIAWLDDRSMSSDIYTQRINSAGVVQWAECGIPLCTATGIQKGLSICSDAHRGAVVAWQDGRSDAGNIRAQRVIEIGAALWQADGVLVCGATGLQETPVAVSDQKGGTIVAWTDHRGANSDIYVQHIDFDLGAALWNTDGNSMCIELGDQKLPSACSDGAGGAVVAWQDARPTAAGFDIYAQRVEPSVGAFQWAPGGVAVCSATGDQVATAIAADPMGGSVVSWIDSRTAPNGTDVYVEHLDSNGASQWTANGAQVCDAAFDQTLAKVVPDGIGGACVVWDDRRNGTNADIYGQRVDAFGQIPDQCVSPTDLVSSTPQTTSAPLNYRTFHQVDFYWSAVGVRGSGGDWDLEMYDTDSYGLQPYPTCFGLPMAGSYSTSQVDFIVEDSNDNITPPGIYGVRAYRYSGTGNALLEWDGGTSELFPNTAGVGSNVAGWTGLLDTYDINLTAGVEYYFKLTTNNPSAQVKVFLFTSLGHAFTNDFKYVVPRSARVAESSGQWMIYTAQGTDYYGLVVLNENGAPVDYTLQAFTSGVAGVHPDGPADLATRLMGLAPNPSSGRVNLAFSLREPASVSFDVLDMAGRVVNRITSQRWEAGTWSVGWDGRRSQGTEAPPGIYFVQMRVDGRPIGLSRLALIR